MISYTLLRLPPPQKIRNPFSVCIACIAHFHSEMSPSHPFKGQIPLEEQGRELLIIIRLPYGVLQDALFFVAPVFCYTN